MKLRASCEARFQTRRVATIATSSNAPTTHSADAEKLQSRIWNHRLSQG
jgi:hypothetical protein